MARCECGKPFVKHTSGEMQTLVGYSRPEPGHNHDDNCRYRIYVCENGHRVRVYRQNRCDACDWRGKATCFCHEGTKVTEWPEAEEMTRDETIAVLLDR